MSRHRNMHDLDEDDYYDDYDDYYEDEDDEAYYLEQERIRKEKEAAAKKKKAAAVAANAAKMKKSAAATAGTAAGSMAKSAANNKTKNTQGGKQGNINQPVAKKAGVSGVTKAPPGFGLPATSPSPTVSGNANTTTTGGGAAGLSVTTNGKGDIKGPSSNNHNNNNAKKKKISPKLHQQLKELKSRLSMVILGHVDAGKSTLMGQVLVQLGLVQKRILNKYQKEASQIGKASFFLAWVMDEDESERERGVTIDIATKYISTTNHDLTILDAPGHADYVPAMITGAASADVGLLVVAATPGEFESGFDFAEDSRLGPGATSKHYGQTREHVILSRGLGVSQLIVAVNKLDGADPPWNEGRFLEIQQRLMPFLQSNGFDKKKVTFVPISGLNGVNINSPPSKEEAPELVQWYKGQTLIQAIDNFEPTKRNIDKPLRFIITDMYAEGKGLTVKGRVVQGLISSGDRIVVLPIGDEATVSRVDHSIVSSPSSSSASASSKDNFDSERLKIAIAGDSVDLYLVGIDVARICPGNIISDIDPQLRPSIQKRIQAKILVMDQLAVPIIRGASVLLHMHSLDIPAQIHTIISKTNKKDGSQILKPRVLTGGSHATVEIKLNAKVCIETFNQCRALGRFVLRRGGDTIAVGVVEEVLGH